MHYVSQQCGEERRVTIFCIFIQKQDEKQANRRRRFQPSADVLLPPAAGPILYHIGRRTHSLAHTTGCLASTEEPFVQIQGVGRRQRRSGREGQKRKTQGNHRRRRGGGAPPVHFLPAKSAKRKEQRNAVPLQKVDSAKKITISCRCPGLSSCGVSCCFSSCSSRLAASGVVGRRRWPHRCLGTAAGRGLFAIRRRQLIGRLVEVSHQVRVGWRHGGRGAGGAPPDGGR